MDNSRRNFLKNISIATGCLCIGSTAVLPSCKPVAYVPYTEKDKRIIVKKSDYGDNKFVVIKHNKLPAPIYLSKFKEEEYIALLMLCTHKQCEVTPYGSVLYCPCHGSEFTNTGKVLNPPATEDLHQFTVTTDEENIIIS